MAPNTTTKHRIIIPAIAPLDRPLPDWLVDPPEASPALVGKGVEVGDWLDKDELMGEEESDVLKVVLLGGVMEVRRDEGFGVMVLGFVVEMRDKELATIGDNGRGCSMMSVDIAKEKIG